MTQGIFRWLSVVVLLLTLYMVISIGCCYSVQHNLKPETLTDLPIIQDIYWIPIASALAFYYLRKTIKAMTKPFFIEIVKDQNDEEMKHARVEKASLLVFKMFFYTISSAWGYLLFRDSDMMPSWLGGEGNVLNLFKNYPYATQHPGLLLYSLV